MGENLIVDLVSSCVSNCIGVISEEACNRFINRIREKKLRKKIEKQIHDFCVKNANLYLDSSSFENFLKYHRPLERIIINAFSIEGAINFEQLVQIIVEEAEEAARKSGQILTIDDKRIIKELCVLINDGITKYSNEILNESQKRLVSQIAQNTSRIQNDLNRIGLGVKESTASIEKIIRESSSINPNMAEAIMKMICRKMWAGEFEDVEKICYLDRKSVV